MPRNDLEFYNRSAAEWWDESAKIFALNRLNPLRFQYFDRHVPHWHGLQVLDVGCGGGFTCEFLARRGAIAHGIDLSHACLEAARTHAANEGLAIAYTPAVAEQLPFKNEQFDAVVCVDVLEHVADWRRAIAEISRVLKPGGFFLFDTPNRTWQSRLILIWLLEDLLQEIPRGIHDWQKFITPAELLTELQRSGFGRTEVKGFNLLGETLAEHWQALQYYRQTGGFRLKLTTDLRLLYIGMAQKLGAAESGDESSFESRAGHGSQTKV